MDPLRPRLEQALASTHVIERELGGGGMSRTYVALERALDRRVVVKVLAPELLAGASVERFRREVLLAAQLQHPHVVPVLSAGEVDGLPWFAMPYVDGDSLRQRLALGPVGIGEAVGILRDVARALAYAHAQGVVHRDIKPDNVLLSGGSATVTDFGIAKAIDAARGATGGFTTNLTVAGTSIGTTVYMAPEQAAGDPDTDHHADLYSFGVMAYEILAGETPLPWALPGAAVGGTDGRDAEGCARAASRLSGYACRTRQMLPEEGAGSATGERHGDDARARHRHLERGHRCGAIDPCRGAHPYRYGARSGR